MSSGFLRSARTSNEVYLGLDGQSLLLSVNELVPPDILAAANRRR